MAEDRTFRVDLRGLVDVLSRHLYSSPRVVVRELVQNAVDAVTTRRRTDPRSPGRVLLVPADVAPDGRLHCLDTGVGLTPQEAETFLATIGSSSKRDELGLARDGLLGQFGIGLLSCFLVGDEVEVVTTTGDGVVTRWVATADGRYRTEVLEGDDVPAEQVLRHELLHAAGVTDWPEPAGGGPGTWVRVRPRRHAAGPTGSGEVERLAARYARMLPVDVRVATPAGPVRVTSGRRPWDVDERTLADRLPEVERLLGVPLLALVPVQVRQAGLTGLVGILAVPTAPTSRQAHTVHARGMLVGTEVDGLLPEWAFFARALVDATGLRLTASREGLYDDDLLAAVREDLAEQLRRWLLRTASVDPVRFADVLRLHESGIRALAVHDDDLFRVYVPSMTVETTLGTMPLGELLRQADVVRWTASVDEFRQLLPVAGAQGLAVVNAGYTFVEELMERLHLLDPPVRQLRVHPGDLDAHVEDPDDDVAARLAPFLRLAAESLAPLQVDVLLRSFRPVTVPAVVLDDREREQLRASREVAARADDVWAGILDALDPGDPAAIRLMLNADSPLVRRLAALEDEHLQTVAVEALWCQALLHGQRPLRPSDQAVLNRSFVELLELALEGGAG